MNFACLDARAVRKLNMAERQSLRNEIKSWGETLAEAHRVIKKYYHTTVPDSLLKQVLCDNLETAYEVYAKTVSDTAAREILMDQVLQKIGVPRWPANCDSESYVEDFYEKFRERGIAHGLTFQPL